MGLKCTLYFRSQDNVKVWEVKNRFQNFNLTFQIGSDTWRWCSRILIKNFLKEGSNPRFHPSVRTLRMTLMHLHFNHEELARWILNWCLFQIPFCKIQMEVIWWKQLTLWLLVSYFRVFSYLTWCFASMQSIKVRIIYKFMLESFHHLWRSVDEFNGDVMEVTYLCK